MPDQKKKMAERKERPSKPATGRWLLVQTIREILASPISVKSQLARVVHEIAAFMEAEVCSLYVHHYSGKLELYANVGLAVDHDREPVVLMEGQGLVGHIARTGKMLNLADASSHASFSYRPGIGEETFRAFLGVPICKEDRTLGVLTIQNRFEEKYSGGSEDILQTVAMMLEGPLSSESLRDIIEGETTGGAKASRPVSLHGDALVGGLALGHIVLHEPRVSVTRLVSKNPKRELRLLDEALKRLTVRIDDLLARGDLSGMGEHRDVLEAYRMFAHDRGWVRRLHHYIREGASAEAAVGRVQTETRERFAQQSDPFFKERLQDLDELSNRLLLELAGKTGTAADSELPDNAILVARTMGPTALLDYDRSKLRGLLLEEGGASSHVAVVARTLGIPALGGVSGLLAQVEAGDEVVIDAADGMVHLRPTRDIVKAYENRVRFHEKRTDRYKKLRNVKARTRDGVAVDLMVNLGLEVNFPHVSASGADGVGLFRTELEFMLSTEMPDLQTQIDLYKQIYAVSDGKPVVFRTLDIGGDKRLPYMDREVEENPAMGWRAVRMSLDRPEVFRLQVQALLQASEKRDLNILIPMVSDVQEFRAVRRIIDEEITLNRKSGAVLPDRVAVGAMVEVPSVLWQLDLLLQETDFVSLGTNDLLQFVFAADRSNVRIAHRFDTLNISVLRILDEVRKAAVKFGKPVSVCGEMAGSPLEALALLGLGYTNLSMSPGSIGPVKAMILSANMKEIRAFVSSLLVRGGKEEMNIRNQLVNWAETRKIEI